MCQDHPQSRKPFQVDIVKFHGMLPWGLQKALEGILAHFISRVVRSRMNVCGPTGMAQPCMVCLPSFSFTNLTFFSKSIMLLSLVKSSIADFEAPVAINLS